MFSTRILYLAPERTSLDAPVGIHAAAPELLAVVREVASERLTREYLDRISLLFVRPGWWNSLTPRPVEATDRPLLSRSFESLGPVVERAVHDVIPASVRWRVLSHIRAWEGEEPGPNRGWVENYLADFTPAERAIGRLAMLAALTPQQVDAIVVQAFRAVTHHDRDLVSVVAWSCYHAVLRLAAQPAEF